MPDFERAPLARIAVVIVNYNTRDLLRACLETVRAEGVGEVVVVDNASTDGSPGMVRAEFPEVRVLANGHNPGYGGGANQGIAACRAPYVLLLNSDTLLGAGAPAALAGWLDRHPRVAIAGPRLLNPDGTLQSSCFPYLKPMDVLVLNTWLNRIARVLPGLRRRYLPTWRGTPASAGRWVKGAALAIRREAFAAVGGFDESYFMYSEEVDLCHRLHGAGWEIHYTPAATVVHVEGASTVQDRHAMAERLFLSLEQFYRRHYPERLSRRLRWVLAAVLLERIARDRFKLWRYPERRERLTGDIALWRRMLRERLEGTRGESRAEAPRPETPSLPQRADWRFLLPEPAGGAFGHLVLLGAPPGLAEWLLEAGVAQRVSESAEGPADAVAVLRGAGVSPAEAARCLAPGGWLYWESDERRSLRSPAAVPRRAIARLRACGLRVAGIWAVWPTFERHEAYVPADLPGALAWFARTHHPTRTFRERAAGVALRLLSRLGPVSATLMTRFFAFTAMAEDAGDVATPSAPVLLTHGAERLAVLHFQRGQHGGTAPSRVLKVPRLPAFNAKTAGEQEILERIRRGLDELDEDTVHALPEPGGTMRYGRVVAGVESCMPGRSLVLTCGGWGVPMRRKERDLRLAAGWLAGFHRQTMLGRDPWDGREIAESFAEFRQRIGATPAEEALFELSLARSRELRGTPFPLVWRHRDFTPWNLLRDRRGRLSVIDWEGARPGPALCDLLHFVSHWSELAAGAAGPEARLRAFAASLEAPVPRGQVDLYCERLGIDRRFVPLLLVHTWVEISLRKPGRSFDTSYVGVLAERAGQLFPEELRDAA